jgi:hypothetical protein
MTEFKSTAGLARGATGPPLAVLEAGWSPSIPTAASAGSTVHLHYQRWSSPNPSSTYWRCC